MRPMESKVLSTDQSTVVALPRQMTQALPKQTTVKLRYYQPVGLDPVAGGAAVNIFSANGIFDPDVSGTGSQPLGLDQWFTFYNKAVVLASKCVIKGLSLTATDAHLMGVNLRITTGSETNPKPYIEDPRCSWAQLANIDGGSTECVINYSAKGFFDVKDPIDNTDLHNTPAANAGQAAYYHVWAGAISTTANPGQLNVQVLIEYTVTFFEPKVLPVS